MASLTIVSGCPGTGKTTLAALLSTASPHGLHFAADVFYDFIGELISPVLPESHAQNTTVTIATARAAAAFASGGYDVFIDGVVGPRWLPLMAVELRPAGIPVDYVVLRAPLGETLRRASERPDGAKFSVEGVRHMHAAFAELGEFDAHVVDTSNQSSVETFAEVSRRRAAGELRLDLAEITGRSSCT